ncbi:MAG: outer membrane beta-barrel protein [Bacteroidota bacterium]|nr:outer membrane beta-barrel protein [Bacteroidota bacterium]
MKKILVLVFVFVGFTLHSRAQGNFELHVGASVPTGDFANDNSNYGGGASTGLNVGIKYFYPLKSHKGLSLTLGVDYLNNGLGQESKDLLKQQAKTSGISDIQINDLDYINVPVLVGLNYKDPVGKAFALFGDAALGVNYSTMTDLVLKATYENTAFKSTTTFTPLTRMAYQIGGGVMICENYIIGLHYNSLGTYSFNGKMTEEALGYKQASATSSNLEVKISMLTLSLGIRF